MIAEPARKAVWETPLPGSLPLSTNPAGKAREAALRAEWASPQEIEAPYRNVSICGNSRVLFNIGGNKYRYPIGSADPVDAIKLRNAERAHHP